jgi:Ca-activated chloride channel family protein
MSNWLAWQQPWWLLLIVIPLLLRLLPQRDRHHPQLEQFIARHLWARLLTGANSASRRETRRFMLGWLLACIALAGPTLQKQQKEEELKRQASVAIVLDISPSMRVTDVAPSRLDYSKRLLTELAQQLKGQRVALIAFSANAYTVLPLTSDNHVLTQMIAAMDPSLASVTGTNLSRALQLAQQALSAPAAGEEKANDGLVLLVSDGEIHDKGALAASRQLHQAGHRLFTLGVGTEQGGPVPFATGRLITAGDELITSRLDRQTLRTLAQAGGGEYADLRPEVWPEIMKVVERLKQPIRSESRRSSGTPLFPWFLGLALIAFLWNGIRRPEMAVLLLTLPLISNSPPSEAAPWDEAKGLRLLEQENNKGASALYSQIKTFNGYIGSGVAAYRLGQWQQALAAFDRALTLARSNEEKGRAAYNRGNALVQLGRIDEASSAYKSTLFWLPGHAKANHNLTLLQRQQPKGGERKAQSDYERQGEGGEEESPRPGGGDKSPAKSDQPGASQPATGQPNGQGAQRQQALQQSLKQWRQNRAADGASPTQTQQQLNTLKEDYQTMLKQRFAIEDVSDAAGLVVERPW